MSLPHPLPDDLVDLIARRFRVIGEPMRIRLLDRLRDGEASVDELAAALGASQQNVSKHLGVLADVGILGRRKDGNHVYYRIVDEGVFALCEEVCGSLQRSSARCNALVDGADGVTSRRARARPGPGPSEPVVGPLGRLGRWTADHVRTVAARLDGRRARARRASRRRSRRRSRGRLAGERLPSPCRPASSSRRTSPGSELGADGGRPLGRADASDPVFRPAGARVDCSSLRTRTSRRLQFPKGGLVDLRTTATRRSWTRGRERRPNGDGGRRRPAQVRAQRRARRRRVSPHRRLRPCGSDFNTANRTAMMKSELISWPVTMAILAARLRLARRRRAAADADDPRPRRLGRACLTVLRAALRGLDLGDELRAHVRARARDRLRALRGAPLPRRASSARSSTARDAVSVTMDTASKAVPFSGLTVLISLSAVMLVPSPAFRSMALGIMLFVRLRAGRDADAPAGRARQVRPAGRHGCSLRWVHSGEHRSARLRPPGASCSGGGRILFGLARGRCVAWLLAAPVVGLRTGMPSIKVVPSGDGSRVGYTPGSGRVRQGCAGNAPDRRSRRLGLGRGRPFAGP